MTARTAAIELLARAGLMVSRSPARQLAVDVRRFGVPDMVIDVGVAQGTPELYEATPEAFLYLIEPLEVFEQDLKRILRSRDGEWIRCAVGAGDGRVDFTVCEDPRKSGRHPRPTSDRTESRSTVVHVRTLDSIFATDPRVLAASCLVLKIDCEGDELAVLLGAVGLLERAAVVIVELALLAGAHSYLPSAVVGLLATSGLELADVILVGRQRGVAQHADAVFARVDRSTAA